MFSGNVHGALIRIYFEFPADKCIQDLQTFDMECIACSCIPQLCDLPVSCYTDTPKDDGLLGRRSWRGVYRQPIRAASVLMGNTPYGKSVIRQKILHNLRRADLKAPQQKEPVYEEPSNLELIMDEMSSDVSILRILITPLAFRSVSSPKSDPKLKNLHKRNDIEKWYGTNNLFPYIKKKSKYHNSK